MNRHLLLGTAGHIDHGKTALIKALTGTNTDRLPEEKRRGITLDLGFAVLEYDDLSIGIVDVPGHEGLIKNMLAGATGIDLALLVVAADEGIMPQTREHFQVLRLLGLSTGVIAITKCDLVDDGWLELVEDELAALVADSFLQDAPTVRTSAKTGAGLEELRVALRSATQPIGDNDSEGPFRMAPFRMAIDRAFSSTGHGTVVTGSVSSGSATLGDSLELMPQGARVQVRALESHSQSVATVGRGQRAALNLSGVHYRDIARGQTLASAGTLRPSKLITVVLEANPERELRLKSRTGVRCYTGAVETPGQLRLLAETQSGGRQSHYAQIELQESVCVVWNQPFILRGLAENALLGGGWVVDPLAYCIKKTDTYRLQKIHELATGDEQLRIAAIAALAGYRDWDELTLAIRTGVIQGDGVVDRLVSTGVLKSFQLGSRRRLLHCETADSLASRLLEKLLDEHGSAPLEGAIPLGRLQRSFSDLQPPILLEAIARQLAEQGKVNLDAKGLTHPKWSGQLTARQADVSTAMIAACEEAGLLPPTVGEFAKRFSLKEEEIESLLQLAAKSEVLVRLPDRESRDSRAARRSRMFLHRTEEKRLIEQVRTNWATGNGWTVGEFREAFGLSRKYAVPLCEHLDKLKITIRSGDRRHVTPLEAVKE
jgi:selenocysteine-specific elongation factor